MTPAAKLASMGLLAVLALACAARPAVVRDGKRVMIFVLVDRASDFRMSVDDRDSREDMAQFIEADLVERLRAEGFLATTIASRDQLIEAPTHYLVTVRLLDVRLVGRGARGVVGFAAGPTLLKANLTVTRPDGQPFVSYDDESNTVRDWNVCPSEVDERLVERVLGGFRAGAL